MINPLDFERLPFRRRGWYLVQVLGYGTALINIMLAIIDVLVKLWLTCGLQLFLAVCAMAVAYLIARIERQEDVPWVLHFQLWFILCTFFLVGVTMLAIWHTLQNLGYAKPD